MKKRKKVIVLQVKRGHNTGEGRRRLASLLLLFKLLPSRSKRKRRRER